jgi:hypothetical protein
MGLLDKNKEPVYSPVSDDRSASSSDDLLYDGDRSTHTTRTKSSRRRTVVLSVGGLLALVAYSALLVTITSAWWRKERLHGANVIDCESRFAARVSLSSIFLIRPLTIAAPAPIRKYIEYEPKVFEMTETSKDYMLVGQPSDELDARWSNLMQYFYAQVPASYMKKLGREKTGIRLKNGNYLANFAWVHQLHCIVRPSLLLVTGTMLPSWLFYQLTRESKRNASIKRTSRTATTPT